MPTRGLRPPPLLLSLTGYLPAALIVAAVAFASTFAGLWPGRTIQGWNNFPGWEELFRPETGCSLAMVVLFGYRHMPAVGIGCTLAIACFCPPSLPWLFGAVHAVQAGLTRLIIRRIQPNPWLRPDIRSCVVLISVGCVLVPLPFAVLGTSILHGFSFADPALLWHQILFRWIGEASSVIVFTPLVLMPFAPEARSDRRRLPEFLVYVGILLVGAWFVFRIDLQYSDPVVPGLFLMFCFSILIARRNGVGLLIIANALFYAVSVAAQTVWTRDLFPPLPPSLLPGGNQIVFAHGLMINVLLTGLLAAAGLFDHRRAGNELRGVSTRVLNALEAERRRLSRDLHDSVCQTVQAVVIRIKLLAREADCVPAGCLKPLTRELDEALDELRQNITGLRPETLDGSDFTGIVRDHCEEFARRHRVNVELFEGDDLPVLPIPVREHLFRVLQESLANAVTHGGAKNIHVRMQGGEQGREQGGEKRLVFTVQDDGLGFDSSMLRAAGRPRYGLRTMQERAFLMGGMFSIESRPGQGALVTVDIPATGQVP
ncbi:MAG: histidine kinase [Opitutaceae bacterium]|jgi:two-component system NarL family sensor kinase|nr:histidine kinase [Opitutaceae bacterium]